MNVFYTPLASKAIIVERETSMRFFWFWPLAAIIFVCAGFLLLHQHPLVMLACVVLAFIPLCGLVWLELRGRVQEPQTLMSWHGGRLFLFEKGRHVRTLRSNQIQHIEITQGRKSIIVQIHIPGELIEQKLTGLGRGQRLQIQRIVRCLQAEITYKNAFDETPEELAALEREIESR